MAWSGSAGSQTFSRSNGVNSGTTTWQSDDTQSAGITSGRHDTHDQDMSDGINSCLKKDGGNTATANIPMGGFVLTNMGDSTARTQSPSTGQLQDGKLVYYPTVGGTVDAITLSGTAAPITAYATGQTFRFLAAGANTSTTPTVNVDGVGAKTIVRTTGAAVAAGEIVSGAIVEITYDGTKFQLRVTAAQVFPTGTQMIFGGSVPTGWDLVVTHHDKALRISNTTPGTGGSAAFSAAFAARTIAKANLPSYTLDNTLGVSLSNATDAWSGGGPGSNGAGGGGTIQTVPVSASQATITGSITGSVTSGGSGTAMDFAVAFVDVNIGQKQ